MQSSAPSTQKQSAEKLKMLRDLSAMLDNVLQTATTMISPSVVAQMAYVCGKGYRTTIDDYGNATCEKIGTGHL